MGAKDIFKTQACDVFKVFKFYLNTFSQFRFFFVLPKIFPLKPTVQRFSFFLIAWQFMSYQFCIFYAFIDESKDVVHTYTYWRCHHRDDDGKSNVYGFFLFCPLVSMALSWLVGTISFNNSQCVFYLPLYVEVDNKSKKKTLQQPLSL